jgi:hypothetical protein
MPLEIVRHDLLMNLKPLRPARLQSIVDELFLPLARTAESLLTSDRRSASSATRRQP